jgi:hypothetical protein
MVRRDHSDAGGRLAPPQLAIERGPRGEVGGETCPVGLLRVRVPGDHHHGATVRSPRPQRRRLAPAGDLLEVSVEQCQQGLDGPIGREGLRRILPIARRVRAGADGGHQEGRGDGLRGHSDDLGALDQDRDVRLGGRRRFGGGMSPRDHQVRRVTEQRSAPQRPEERCRNVDIGIDVEEVRGLLLRGVPEQPVVETVLGPSDGEHHEHGAALGHLHVRKLHVPSPGRPGRAARYSGNENG